MATETLTIKIGRDAYGLLLTQDQYDYLDRNNLIEHFEDGASYYCATRLLVIVVDGGPDSPGVVRLKEHLTKHATE